MTTHFTKFETNKKKEPELFFASQYFLNKGHQAGKRAAKIFSGKNGQKTAKNSLKHIFWTKNCFTRDLSGLLSLDFFSK